MSNYTKLTNFASKDALPSGNASKIVKGAEIDAEFNAIATAISTKLDAADFPVGGIIIWSGSLGTIPAKWQLCDGTNGTPNLRDRFVVGAGSTYAVGATGGANTVQLSLAEMPSHNHSGTTDGAGAHTHLVNDPGHIHGTPNGGFTTPSGGSAAYSGSGGSVGAVGATDNSPTGISLNPVDAHQHSFGTSFSGSSAAHENRPPYYALCYIMKISA